ncbi:AzlD domain-containing protein [Neptunicoccus sediminis]|uniref:AzlD domain-containing protein n=1 Tax=Neptunicoccus sediminis TaxID=1892596 RepID=UPI000845E466|nr:AzlD domain-containing protein [Neptunicoccus sediminis]
MTLDQTQIWIVIAGMAFGTFFIRWSFLGLLGDRELPQWALRHLRYTAVAILPGLIAPLILWPSATGGEPDPARLLAALVAFGMGMWRKSALWAIFSGLTTLYAVQYLLG